MHWADAFFKDNSDETISTGISPSGPIHIGNMREILTGDILFKSSLRKGKNSRFIYLCDDADPLRKVYPFLPESYIQHVGKPLYKIPSPDGNGVYSEYFLRPFLKTLDILNVKVEVIRSSSLYSSGVMSEAIRIIFENYRKVSEILREISGRELSAEWAPFNPECESCGRITTTSVEKLSYPVLTYRCRCGFSGQVDVTKGGGKLPWRLEWPAKWFALGVTTEPFGKDHGASGGSYDTGARIATEIFRINPPKPLMFERILLKGVGVMHSSTGVNIAANEFIENAPAETLRFLMSKNQPSRHINFDPGIGLLNITDEIEKYKRAYFGTDNVSEENLESVLLYSSLSDTIEKPLGISFRHLVTLVQIYSDNSSILKIAGKSVEDTERLIKLIEVARKWVAKYAPEELLFKLTPVGTSVKLNEMEKNFLQMLKEGLAETEWIPEGIHNCIHESIKKSGIDQENGFSVIYRILINKQKGPRLGYFLFGLGREFVEGRINDCL